MTVNVVRLSVDVQYCAQLRITQYWKKYFFQHLVDSELDYVPGKNKHAGIIFSFIS